MTNIRRRDEPGQRYSQQEYTDPDVSSHSSYNELQQELKDVDSLKIIHEV